ncbi:hypothetical protein GGS24DRAFT_497011 [Hypoxylon argillaceum]|nr:hypothetical protein GGS24DRAFT_497011 [Hypoxylon argillaceum]KAI1149470.1 hypothetical protein F4825DRAFT_453443 [Nemania diffusa]
MSSTIAIPTARSSATACGQSSKTCTSSSSSFSSSPQTPASANSETPGSSHKPKAIHHRRPSLLSSALSKEECTHINVGDPDGPPRLISYLASSQGFVWNPEMFLPSYLDLDYEPLENRREPVHEIRLSDEEIKNMLP